MNCFIIEKMNLKLIFVFIFFFYLDVNCTPVNNKPIIGKNICSNSKIDLIEIFFNNIKSFNYVNFDRYLVLILLWFDNLCLFL